MKTRILLIALAFILPPVASAQDGGSAQIQEIIGKHEQQMAAFSEKMRATPRAEQGKLYQTEFPDASEGIAAVAELVKTNPQDVVNLEAIT